MTTKPKKMYDMTRFDTRLSKEQKVLFERAASAGGYRSLTDFVLQAAHEKADKIIRESEIILASQQDRDVFFEAIINAGKPGSKLIAAAEKHKKALSD